MSDTQIDQVTRVIDRPEALELLRSAMRMKGATHTVTECVYVHQGDPSCLIGHALAVIDPELAMSAGQDTVRSDYSGTQVCINSMNANAPGFAKWLASHGVTLTPAAWRAWNAAQVAQDIGTTWGLAVAAAEEAL